MPMPWTLEHERYGNSGDIRHVKRHADGLVSMASADDVAVWEHVQALYIERDTLNAAYAELERRIEAQPQPVAQPVAQPQKKR